MDQPIKILIVEEQDLISTQLLNQLSSLEYSVMGVAKNRNEALDIIENIVPDLILMGVVLANNDDGIDLANNINMAYNIPIIYMTTTSNPTIMKRASKSNQYGFIHSGINLNQLDRQIQYALIKSKNDKEKLVISDELKKNKQFFKSVFENSREGIFIINSDFIITNLNKSAENILRIKKEKINNTNFLNKFLPIQYHDDFKLAIENILKSNNSELFDEVLELFLYNNETQLIPIELKLSALDLSDEIIIGIFFRDVSERINKENELIFLIEDIQIAKEQVEKNTSKIIRLNHKLQEDEIQLKELNASKDRFFSLIAHDLKGPFQGLLGYSGILAKNLDKLEQDEILDFAKNLNDSAKNLFKLLENLLHWSKLQRGHIEYHPEIMNLNTMVKINLELLKARADQKNIKLVNQLDEEINVYSDENMLNTVIRNLLSNAVKFTYPQKEIGFKITKKGPQNIIATVYDTGVGMTQDTMDKLFKIDSKITTLGTEKETGTGLGLILCKELIQENQGDIWVNSKLGEGSEFSFTIPLNHNSI